MMGGRRSREKFSDLFKQIISAAKSDKRIHDATMVLDNNAGITIMSGMSASWHELEIKCPGFCILKKHETKSNLWAELLTLVDQPGLVHGFILLDEPWTEDAELDRVLSTRKKRAHGPAKN